jgi:hypothetical protein
LALGFLPRQLLALHFGNHRRVIPQRKTGFFQHHHEAIDQRRVTTFIGQVLIDLLKREEPPLGRLGKHGLKRTVKTMHEWTPSMEFTSVQLPSAAADVP